jgi:hypothetical protein
MADTPVFVIVDMSVSPVYEAQQDRRPTTLASCFNDWTPSGLLLELVVW